MHKAQRLILVAMVAAALCADRMATSAPVLRPQMAAVARRLALRLVVSFRNVITALRMRIQRRSERSTQSAPLLAAWLKYFVRWPDFSPVQFRLPPPVAAC